MQPSSGKGYAYVAASILVAAAVIASSILVSPLETTKTSTSTATSVVTSTPAPVTTTSTLTETTTSTSTSLTAFTYTVTVTQGIQGGDTCSPTSFNQASGQPQQAATGKAPNATATKPVTVGMSIQGSATNSSSQRKTFVASGLRWVFYTDGQNLVYQTSSGNASWSIPPTVVRDNVQRGWFFTLAQNGTTLFVVVAATDGSTNGVEFMKGTMNVDGTISWSVQESFPYSGVGSDVPSFALDSAGNPWIAVDALNGSCRNIEAFKDTGGLWSQVYELGSFANYARPLLVPLADGKMAIEILTETPVARQVVVVTSPDGGATWSTPIATSPDEMLTLSAVSIGDTIYSVTTDEGGHVYLWSYAYGDTAFGGPVAIANWTGSLEGDASITTDGSNLVVAYSSATSVSFLTSPDLGGTWTAPSLISSMEMHVQTDSLGTSPIVNGTVNVVWTAQDYTGGTSFDVRYAALSLGA